MSLKALAGSFLLMGLWGSAWAEGEIYVCTDAKGNRHTSDRLIPECQDREHRILGPDGSLRKVLPPPLTQAEEAAKKAREAREAEAAASRKESQRRDMAMLRRYPNQDAHNAARRAALDVPLSAIRQGEKHLESLTKQRLPLQEELDGLGGKSVPSDLRQRVNASDAAIRAQKEFLKAQQAEIDRLNTHFDSELLGLRKLWANYGPQGKASPGADASSAR